MTVMALVTQFYIELGNLFRHSLRVAFRVFREILKTKVDYQRQKIVEREEREESKASAEMLIDDVFSFIYSSLFGLVQNLLHGCLPTQIMFFNQLAIHFRSEINGIHRKLLQSFDAWNHSHPQHPRENGS